MPLSLSRVRELLLYEPSSGRFFWHVAPSRRVSVGDQAGSLGFNGYWSIRIDGVLYYVHRLVWLVENGAWPSGWIDHRDGDKSNNRIANLREATASQNGANSRLAITSASGCKGVSFNKRRGRWHAYLCVAGRRQHLGFHDTREAAAAAYDAAAVAAFGAFARTNAMENSL